MKKKGNSTRPRWHIARSQYGVYWPTQNPFLADKSQGFTLIQGITFLTFAEAEIHCRNIYNKSNAKKDQSASCPQCGLKKRIATPRRKRVRA